MINNDELMHYGVLGMKWGVRKARNHAKKDAKEYARARMFYGEGAGTRRKLINNTVKQRSKDPIYKKAFDDALAKENMAKNASRAKRERKIKDAQKSTIRTGKGVVNIVTGHPERRGAGMAAGYGMYQLAKKTGVNRIIMANAKNRFSSIKDQYYRRKGYEFLKRMGL